MCAVAAMEVGFSRDWNAEAARRGAKKLVLNARDNATEFYAKHGYAVVGEAETLFGIFALCGWRKFCCKISQTSIFRS